MVLLKLEQGKSPAQISKDLNNVVSERTVRNWKAMYLKTGNIDLKTPPGPPRIVRTKSMIQKVKKRFESQARQSGRKVARQLGISQSSLARITRQDLGLHAYRITIEPKLTDVQKQARVTFAYWVRRTLRKADIRKILFSDEKYFGVDGIYNRQNDRVYAASREEADEAGAIHRKTKYPGQIMVWLGASYAGVTAPIIFKPHETLKQENYVEHVLPFALSEGKRLIGKNFIFQQDNATPHTSNRSQIWCKKNFYDFFDKNRWPGNSPDLNILDYYVWDAVNRLIKWNNVNDYQSLQNEIERAVPLVSKNALASSIDSWSRRILSILKTKGQYIR